MQLKLGQGLQLATLCALEYTEHLNFATIIRQKNMKPALYYFHEIELSWLKAGQSVNKNQPTKLIANKWQEHLYKQNKHIEVFFD
jgi:hypothetical protein